MIANAATGAMLSVFAKLRSALWKGLAKAPNKGITARAEIQRAALNRK